MPSRGRFFKYRDRASYKISEVLGLFIISMGLGMIFFGICVALDHLSNWLFSTF